MVCVSTFSCGTATSTPVQINVAATISTGAITGDPFCAGASFDVPLPAPASSAVILIRSSCRIRPAPFASPTVIGTLVSDANSGLINVTIPANTAAGTGYQLRVVSQRPGCDGFSYGGLYDQPDPYGILCGKALRPVQLACR